MQRSSDIDIGDRLYKSLAETPSALRCASADLENYATEAPGVRVRGSTDGGAPFGFDPSQPAKRVRIQPNGHSAEAQLDFTKLTNDMTVAAMARVGERGLKGREATIAVFQELQAMQEQAPAVVVSNNSRPAEKSIKRAEALPATPVLATVSQAKPLSSKQAGRTVDLMSLVHGGGSEVEVDRPAKVKPVVARAQRVELATKASGTFTVSCGGVYVTEANEFLWLEFFDHEDDENQFVWEPPQGTAIAVRPVGGSFVYRCQYMCETMRVRGYRYVSLVIEQVRAVEE